MEDVELENGVQLRHEKATHMSGLLANTTVRSGCTPAAVLPSQVDRPIRRELAPADASDQASHDSAHATRAASPPASASAAREMPGSPTKRARLATDRAVASAADLPQEGPFFGHDSKTKCRLDLS